MAGRQPDRQHRHSGVLQVLGVSGRKPGGADRLDRIPLRLPVLDVVLPVGLSFHTFQAMSYTFDVYYGRQNRTPSRHLRVVRHVLSAIGGGSHRTTGTIVAAIPGTSYDRLRTYQQRAGAYALGLFKRSSSPTVCLCLWIPSFGNPRGYGGITMVWAVLFFSIQIYADFSGYCDIALGAAQVMGFRLMENFRHPYFSASFREFWTRWHISLSQWFRDFVYIPRAGIRFRSSKKSVTC